MGVFSAVLINPNKSIIITVLSTVSGWGKGNSDRGTAADWLYYRRLKPEPSKPLLSISKKKSNHSGGTSHICEHKLQDTHTWMETLFIFKQRDGTAKVVWDPRLNLFQMPTSNPLQLMQTKFNILFWSAKCYSVPDNKLINLKKYLHY